MEQWWIQLEVWLTLTGMDVPFGKLIANKFGTQTAPLVALLFLWMLGWVATILHECGHVVFGEWFGIPVREVRIGAGPGISLQLPGGCSVRIGMLPGGYADFLYLPISRARRIAMYAGGSVATASVGLLLAGVIALLRILAIPVGTSGTLALYVFGLYTIGNFVPVSRRSSGFWSDGAAILGLLLAEMRANSRGSK